MKDRATYRRELQQAIKDTEDHLFNLRMELEDVERNYVQVRFIEGFNEYSAPSERLYTYIDPSGELVAGDYVLAGFKNALAVVERIGLTVDEVHSLRRRGIQVRDLKPINFRLKAERV